MAGFDLKKILYPFQLRSLQKRVENLQKENVRILLDVDNLITYRKVFMTNCKMELLPIISHHKYGFIDKNGNIVIKPTYDDYKGKFISCSPIAVCVKQNNKWGAILSNNHILINFEYDYIYPSIVDYTEYQVNCSYFEQLFTVCKNYQWGVLDHNGDIFVEFGKYDWIDGYDSGLARVKKGNKWGLIDFTGNIILPIEQDNIWNFYNRKRTDTIVEKNEIQTNVDFEELLSKYNEDFDDDCFDFNNLKPSSNSVYDNPYYNENLDFDQQDPEFWESL